MTRRDFLKLVGAGALAARWPGKSQAQGLVDIRVGYLPSVSFAPLFLADDAGYFKENGIRIRYQEVTSGAKGVTLMVAEELDALGSSLAASIFSAVAHGISLKVVADKGVYLPGLPNPAKILVRKDLHDKGLRRIKELRGMRLAITGRATLSHYYAARILDKGGLYEEEVELVPMSYADMVLGLAADTIDAAAAVEPFATRALTLGVGKILVDFGQVLGLEQYSHLVIGETLERERSEVVSSFIEAYVRGIRRYYQLGPFHDEVVACLERHTRLKREIIRQMSPSWFEINGDVLTLSIAEQQHWFWKKGYIKQKLDLDQLIEKRYLAQAWQRLGKVPLPGKDYWSKSRPVKLSPHNGGGGG